MPNVLNDLGDGLLLKQATSADVDRLANYNARYLSDDGPDQPEEVVFHETRDLMTNHHATTAADFTYVEDSATGQIVSSLCLISQTWCYDEIPFGVGRVELVSTHHDYRRRGLVRAQFDVVHRWSQQRGEKMQAITGIPYFYRQFGYEMTMTLGGRRRGYRPHIPKLNEGEVELYQFRPAAEEDIPFLIKVYDRGRQRSLFSCPRDERIFRYELQEQHQSYSGDMIIIEDDIQRPVGFVWHSRQLFGSSIDMFTYELAPGQSWAAVTPCVIRYLAKAGEEVASQDETKTLESITFSLGPEHPVYEVAHRNLPEVIRSYAWYIRVPDIPDFIQHISPVLNRRLAASDYAVYDGELLLSFHRSGVKLLIEKGRLTRARSWQPAAEQRGDLAFPPLTFLHLLCGYRTFEELEAFYPDCYRGKKGEAPALINTLFPKKSSSVFGIA